MRYVFKKTDFKFVLHLFWNILQYFLRHFKVAGKDFRPKLSIFIEIGNEGLKLILVYFLVCVLVSFSVFVLVLVCFYFYWDWERRVDVTDVEANLFNSTEKDTLAQNFSFKFCEIFRSPFF